MSVTSLRLQPELSSPLDYLAEKLNRSKNFLINQAIKEFVEKESLEEQRWQETLVALDSVAKGELVPGDDVRQWLQSWGTEQELPPPTV